MREFWRTVPGALVLSISALLAVGSGVAFVQVYRATHPAREQASPEGLGALLSGKEEVRLRAADGIELQGWLFRGRPGDHAIVLGHDLGQSKAALETLAIALQNAGFTVLAVDFRAHGASGGDRSTLGIEEKRDLAGAVDFLSSLDGVDDHRIGAYGVGLGAHAAVLAAADRPALKVLVLDGLYPDASYPLVRHVFGGWVFGARRLSPLPIRVFETLCRVDSRKDSASASLPRLLGREILLVAPAADARLAVEMEKLYRSVPEQKNADASLITLPATRLGALYGEEVERYHKKVVSFFEHRLARRRIADDE